jgi:hypothetical protein
MWTIAGWSGIGLSKYLMNVKALKRWSIEERVKIEQENNSILFTFLAQILRLKISKNRDKLITKWKIKFIDTKFFSIYCN